MLDKLSDYPALQAEDDGFLMQLRDEVIAPHLPTLGMSAHDSLSECISRLREESQYAVDKGPSLPLYEPARDDEGTIRGYSAFAVWAGSHVDIPLYNDIAIEDVENIIKGVNRTPGKLDEGFLAFTPAFRVALIVHHTIQNVAINPLAAEAFALSRYGDLNLKDNHYSEFGVPTTEHVRLSSTTGLSTEWIAISPSQYREYHRAQRRINGWSIRIRGAEPKRETLVKTWNDIRNRLELPHETAYTVGGAKMQYPEARKTGGVRRRVGDPDVARMCDWVNEALAKNVFPMRGKQMSWKDAVVMFGKAYPNLADRWTADSMRKSYQHHESK